jgi:integrase
MRFGELFGLRIGDLRLDEGYLRVTKQLVNGRNGLELGEPKTPASKRRSDLPATTVEVLREHLKKLDGKPNEYGLVFPNRTGGFIDHNNFRSEVFKPLLIAAELPDCTFHSLRHAGNCMLASGGGVSMKALQARLGQATSKTTFDVYTHLFEGDGRRAADAMDVLLSGVNRGVTVSDGAPPTKVGNEKTPAVQGFKVVGHSGIEPETSCLSSMRSNQLS